MFKSDYAYTLVRYAGHDCLLIEDLDLGGRSVTNDIENVVKEIEAKEQIDASDYTIVYKDSEDSWDGWSKQDSFIPMRCYEWQAAVMKMFSLSEKPQQVGAG